LQPKQEVTFVSKNSKTYKRILITFLDGLVIGL